MHAKMLLDLHQATRNIFVTGVIEGLGNEIGIRVFIPINELRRINTVFFQIRFQIVTVKSPTHEITRIYLNYFYIHFMKDTFYIINTVKFGNSENISWVQISILPYSYI